MSAEAVLTIEASAAVAKASKRSAVVVLYCTYTAPAADLNMSLRSASAAPDNVPEKLGPTFVVAFGSERCFATTSSIAL